MNSSSFSQWLEDQKNQSSGTNTSGSDNESLLPLFITGSAKDFQDSVSGSFNTLKSSFESQFPSKVCGMSYPERFRVCFIVVVLGRLYTSVLVEGTNLKKKCFFFLHFLCSLTSYFRSMKMTLVSMDIFGIILYYS